MTRLLITALGIFLLIGLQAQKGKDGMLDVLDDEDAIEEGLQTLRFFDSQTGDPLKNATVTIAEVGDYTTDIEGKIQFPCEEDGYFEVTFKKEGYITCDFQVEVIADMIFFNRFSVSPKMEIGHLRLVLDWSNTPADLDAHLTKENAYHISYRDTRVLSDGTGMLDRDDMDGFGPETITITDIDDNATYQFFVYNYTDRNNSGSTTLSKSKASVNVFANNEFLGKVEIPVGSRGLKWVVLEIENGEFKIVNQIQ